MDNLPFGLCQARKGFKKSKYIRKAVGCAYIQGSKIIVGSNDLKTSPLSALLGSRMNRIHAEVAVLKQVNWEDVSGTLYVYRERKNGSLGLARPCHSCMKLIRQKGIKRIVYSTYGGFAKEKLIE